MSAHQKGILALITANIIWGAASPIFKFALQNISPFTLAFIRFYGATLILLPFAYPYLKIHKKDYLKIFWLSFKNEKGLFKVEKRTLIRQDW